MFKGRLVWCPPGLCLLVLKSLNPSGFMVASDDYTLMAYPLTPKRMLLLLEILVNLAPSLSRMLQRRFQRKIHMSH